MNRELRIAERLVRIFTVLIIASLVAIYVDLLVGLLFGPGILDGIRALSGLPLYSIPLGFLRGIGLAFAPFGFIIGCCVWFAALYLLKRVFQALGIYRWDKPGTVAARYRFGRSIGALEAGPKLDLPGDEHYVRDRQTHTLTFFLGEGPGRESVHSEDGVLVEGRVDFHFNPADFNTVVLLGTEEGNELGSLCEQRMRPLALQAIDSAISDKEYATSLMGTSAVEALTVEIESAFRDRRPSEQLRRHVARFPGLVERAAAAQSAVEIFGLELDEVTLHIDENVEIARAAERKLAASEEGGALALRAARMLGFTGSDKEAVEAFNALSHEKRSEALLIAAGKVTKSEKKSTVGVDEGLGELVQNAVGTVLESLNRREK